MRVAVLAGGRSSEHDVSLASAEAVRTALREGGHEVVWVQIERDGAWRCEGERVQVAPGGGLLDVDVAFPVLHGPYGEDGTVQGMLETLDVAYVGAGVAAAAVCMDKVLFKDLMRAAQMPQVDYRGVRAAHWRECPAQVLDELEALGLPVFVKPAHLGSSVGIVKVSERTQLEEALGLALAHDELAIVEAMAHGLEVECGVLDGGVVDEDDPTNGAWRSGTVDGGPPVDGVASANGAMLRLAERLASEPGEIVLPLGTDWYDYEAKYTQGGMELVIPARISATARERVRELALVAFARTGCAGLARVDFFVDGELVLLNELNTMPGFTPTSVYAKLMAASGVPYQELVERLCRLGIVRHDAGRAFRY
jgi:D-alanine-D-alanine ligase